MVTSHPEPRGSCTLGVKISIGLWRGLLPLLTSRIAHEILISAPSSARMMPSLYSLCLDRAASFHSWPVMETTSTSTTMVSTRCISVAATTTTLAWLRYFVRRVLARQGRIFPTPWEMMRTSRQLLVVFHTLVYFELLFLFVLAFSTTSIIFEK